MNTALVPFDDMERMANAIAKSGLFGIKTQEQCIALMLIAQAQGQHPAIVARDYDIIQGRPAKKSEAMLRDFLDAGGKVEWHAMTDVLADATFSHPQGGSARITWDMERAKKAGLAGKDTWARYPRPMLANRVISEGCRRIYPASTSGMYEPGEVRDMTAPPVRREPRDMGKAEIVDPDTGEITPTTAPAAPAPPKASASSSAPEPVSAGPSAADDDARAELQAADCRAISVAFTETELLGIYTDLYRGAKGDAERRLWLVAAKDRQKKALAGKVAAPPATQPAVGAFDDMKDDVL